MATISTLAVNLIARTSSFERGMNRGRKSVRGLRASIQGAIGTVARFAKRLALIAGIGAMGFFLKTTLASLDAVSKLSRRIGLATETLLGLRFAAGLAGVSTQALDKSLEIFVRRMGEVKSGSGEATRGLEALGLSAEQMIAVTPEKALLLVADRIQNLGTQAEKSAAAYFLFGRAGAQLLNLFEDGAAGIAKAQKEADRLGVTLKGFDLTKVEQANDAVSKLNQSLKIVLTTIVIRLTPAIKKLADFMTQYRDAIIGSIKNSVVFAAKAFIMVKTIKLVVIGIKAIISVYKALAARQITFLALSGPKGWAILAGSIVAATLAIVTMNLVIDDTVAGIKEMAAATSKLEEISKEPETIAGIDKSIALQRKMIQDAKNLDLASDPFGIAEAIVTSGQVRIQQLQKQRDILQAQLNITQQQNRLASDLAAKEKERTDRLKLEQASLGGIAKFIESLRTKIDTVGLSLLETQLFKIEKLADKLGGEAWLAFNKGVSKAIDLIDKLKGKSALIGIDKFIESLEIQIDTVGLSSLEKQLQALQKQSLSLEGLEFLKFAEGVAKAIDLIDILKKKQGALEEQPIGQFQQIRSAFIDVAALSGRTRDQGIDKQNRLTEQTNEILRDIKSQNQGTATI